MSCRIYHVLAWDAQDPRPIQNGSRNQIYQGGVGLLVTETGDSLRKKKGHGGRDEVTLKFTRLEPGTASVGKEASHGAYRYRDGHSGFGIIRVCRRDDPRDDLALPASSYHSAASAICFGS